MKLIKKVYKSLLPERIRLKIAHLKYILRGFRYRGNKVICNCCEKTYRGFLPFGHIPRPDAECPGCHSLERHRLLLLYLQNETVFFQKKLKVLHFAPEYMLEKKFKKLQNLDYLSCDLNPAFAMKQIDISDINLPDNSFDFIICLHVLMYVPDEKQALRELHRILKPGGTLILQTFINQEFETAQPVTHLSREEKAKRFGEPDWVRRHGKDFPETVSAAGFKVSIEDYISRFSPGMIRKYGLGEGEPIYHCTKE